MQHATETQPKGTRSTADAPRLPGVDGRTKSARRTRELYYGFHSALGRETTPAEQALLVDATALTLESEALAARAAAGERVDADLRVRVSGALARALERLGLVPRPAAPEPADDDPAAHLAKIRDPEYWRTKRQGGAS